MTFFYPKSREIRKGIFSSELLIWIWFQFFFNPDPPKQKKKKNKTKWFSCHKIIDKTVYIFLFFRHPTSPKNKQTIFFFFLTVTLGKNKKEFENLAIWHKNEWKRKEKKTQTEKKTHENISPAYCMSAVLSFSAEERKKNTLPN